MVRYKRHLEMGTNEKEANPFSKSRVSIGVEHATGAVAPWLERSRVASPS